ncbi:hypothetical protein OAA06_01495 [bacterium]|nr:hypothetical protein [bacterium]
MKTKIILGVLILLSAVGFAGNWMYGNHLSEKIDNKLTQKIEQANLPVEITYQEVKVNPLLSKLKLNDVNVESKTSSSFVSFESVDISMPYNQAIRLLESNEIEELKSFGLQMNQALVFSEEIGSQVTGEKVTVKFDGYINKEIIENLDKQFPSQTIKATIACEGIKLEDAAWMNALGMDDELKELLTQDASFLSSIEFLPELSELKVNKITLKSPLLEYKSKGTMHYSGSGFNNAKATYVETDSKLELVSKQLAWGNPELTGRFSIKNLKSSFNGRIVLDDEGVDLLPDYESSFLLEGFEAEFEGAMKTKMQGQSSLLGISANEFIVEKFEFNSKMKDENLVVKDAELISSVMKLFLSADVQFNASQPAMSTVNFAELKIKDLAEGLEKSIANLEVVLSQKFPREGDDIVLELSGTLSRPKVKGVSF